MIAFIPLDVRIAFALLPIVAAVAIFHSAAAVFAVLYLMLCAYIIVSMVGKSKDIQCINCEKALSSRRWVFARLQIALI